MKRKKAQPRRKPKATRSQTGFGAKVTLQKARERAENHILRGNDEIANQLEKAAASRSKLHNLNIWDQLTNLLLKEAADALRQSDRIRPDDDRRQDAATLFRADEARKAALRSEEASEAEASEAEKADED